MNTKISARKRAARPTSADASAAIVVVADSKNGKVAAGPRGRVAATYAPTATTCPSTCALRGAGCYAESGRVGMLTSKINAASEGFSPLAIARAERRAIEGLFDGGPVPQDGRRGGRDLRIHVAGDARTVPAARELARAAADWKRRGGGAAWTYTHAWRDVPRDAWGSVSVLASVDDHRDASAARAQGYAPATVVDAFPGDARAFKLQGSDVTWIACREQREGVPCAECRLCFSADALRDAGRGIAFAAHSAGAGRIKRRLAVVK